MIKRFLKYGVVIALYTLILVFSEVAYRSVFDVPKLENLKDTFLIIGLFVTLFCCSKWRWSRYCIVLFFFLSVLINNVHYAIYHGWITGMNYYLMFAEMREVSTAGKGMIGHLLPQISWAVVDGLIFVSSGYWFQRWRNNSSACAWKYPIADTLFFIAILFIIIRSFSTVHGQGVAPDSGYSRIKANYFSFGYFIGRILPYQLFDLSKVPAYSSQEPAVKNPPKIRNIILIMGESESAMHLQTFGYHRETSPFFNSLAKTQSQAVIKPIYSAGKLTFISLPMLFNAIPRPNGFRQINEGTTNLFRLAQKQGFWTQFHTAQPESEMELMNLIGVKWLNQVSYPTELGYSKEVGMNDNLLFPYLEQTDLTQGSKLIVLHQRGSHMPYAHYLSDAEKYFKDGSNLDNYDSTIRHTDLFIQKVYEYLQKQPQPDWLLIYTSDHGQYVTANIANQGTNVEDAYVVPLMIYTPNASLQQAAREQFLSCPHRFHQQLAEFMLYSMGYDVPLATSCVAGVVTNNSLTGDIGWIEIDKNNVEQEVLPK